MYMREDMRQDTVPHPVGRGGGRQMACHIPHSTMVPTFMILGFGDAETEKIWRGETSRRLPHNMQPVARRKLRMLNNAASLQDLRIPPANRLEKLSGDRSGQYSIRINDQWRLCFSWRNDDHAENVEIVDYHR